MPTSFSASSARPGWAPGEYEPLDTKLARSAKPYFVIQLCLYAELMAGVQGEVPESVGLVLNKRGLQTFDFDEFGSYFRRMKSRFLAAVETELADTYPEPVEHCELCDWMVPCEERREGDDHLSLVAKLSRGQAVKLGEEGIGTVAALAAANDGQRPRGMAADTFEKLRSQAGLQVAERESGERASALLKPGEPGLGPPRGFALMPEPSEGDVFFDIEGDPFFDGGLEYLWGSTTRGRRARVPPLLGHDPSGEKRAFEEFVDFVCERRERFPDMHVYHYAPYERTALEG